MGCIDIIKDNIVAIKNTVLILWRWAEGKLKIWVLLQTNCRAWLGDIKNESSYVRSKNVGKS